MGPKINATLASVNLNCWQKPIHSQTVSSKCICTSGWDKVSGPRGLTFYLSPSVHSFIPVTLEALREDCTKLFLHWHVVESKVLLESIDSGRLASSTMLFFSWKVMHSADDLEEEENSTTICKYSPCKMQNKNTKSQLQTRWLNGFA